MVFIQWKFHKSPNMLFTYGHHLYPIILQYLQSLSSRLTHVTTIRTA